jgi:acyl transferase domain-containing protein
MDPQQRLLLQGAQKALEDAGYVGDSTPTFQRASTGCYIGLATGDYTDNLRNDIDVFYSTGTLRAGPSIVTDTACSSSMVSVYQACRALQNGDCTTAIAGGINVITSPDVSIPYGDGDFRSRGGICIC